MYTQMTVKACGSLEMVYKCQLMFKRKYNVAIWTSVLLTWRKLLIFFQTYFISSDSEIDFFYFISDLDYNDQNEEGSPGGKTISGVKLSMTGADSQAIAQQLYFHLFRERDTQRSLIFWFQTFWFHQIQLELSCMMLLITFWYAVCLCQSFNLVHPSLWKLHLSLFFGWCCIIECFVMG